MSFELRKHNDPALSTVCEPLSEGDDLGFLADMRKACDVYNGVGLAAPQIGVTKRAVFIWPKRKGGEAIFMLNPVICWTSPAKATEEEGCLSYPRFFTPVERHLAVTVAYFDETWAQHERQFSFHEARVIQHEVDHLDGICRVGDAWRATSGPAMQSV